MPKIVIVISVGPGGICLIDYYVSEDADSKKKKEKSTRFTLLKC
jgi:hypothetical protein